ncbi:unnamed protein product [Miscanthus lutarioriparius]|uniref:Uncharacterized protein n=1 Tax=Miscanthus lutarioriparius TaxID=422564 RepID=A0A811NUY9_9POAL|nr:unnamed protein product [Miscanthus lutarioriparius]
MPRRRNKPLLLSAISLLVLAWPASCADPVLLPVSKDTVTSLYTIPVRDGANHVIYLAGPLLWSTCAADHLPPKISCHDTACKLANAYRAPRCHEAAQLCASKTQCTAYPYNLVTGRCAAASLVHTRLIANTTDGRNPLSQVSVRAVAACTPRTLLPRLPAGAGVAGVAGRLARRPALPAQVAASQRVANRFLLCLPRSGGGEGWRSSAGPRCSSSPESAIADLTSTLAFTALRRRRDNPLYYIPVSGVTVNQAQVQHPAHALSTGGVVLCIRVPYTAIRPDVYRPVVQAFDRALARNDAKVPVVAPFELCYRSSMLGNTRLGYAVPDIALVLEDGKSWMFVSSSSMVDVNGQTACLAFVEMKGVKAVDLAVAAVVVRGFQMENHLLQFDLERRGPALREQDPVHGVPVQPRHGRCAAASLVHTRLIANTTDGRNPLSQVSVRAVAACTLRTLLPRLPAGAAGVAGSRTTASPCLRRSRRRSASPTGSCSASPGPAAARGWRSSAGPRCSSSPESAIADLTSTLAFTALRRRRDNPLYYIPVSGVTVNQAQVQHPAHALSTGGVVLCIRVPYTAIRPDVYRPVVQAFDRALARNDAKVPVVAPFELCYRSSMLGNTRLGYAVPDIALVLEDGKSWMFVSSSSMVDVNGQTACLAFVEMKGVKAVDLAVAAVVRIDIILVIKTIP